LVLIFRPTIRKQSRLLSERHDPSRPSLDGLFECSQRNPVITGKRDQLLDVGIRVIPELDGIRKVEWVARCPFRAE
jgi:hypothetical protein